MLFALTAATLPSGMADACGGLFCDTTIDNQVSQSAERIMFVDHADGRVSAVVEILYQGEADKFSWLVPVPGIPEVGLSSSAALDILQGNTNPRYVLNSDQSSCDMNFQNNGANNGFNNGANNGGGVTVVASGDTGPFNWEVIEVDPDLDDPAQVATDWLEREGYDVAGPELLREYLEAGMNIIGFRLDKFATVGSIRPVILTYTTDHPMIPIKLTAVAAQENMGVLTWVVGPHRAVPTNYRHLVLNDALINWFDPASNYSDVINAAADEAGGQGWVTEFAGGTQVLGSVIWSDSREQTWGFMQEAETTPVLLRYLVNDFGDLDGVEDVVRTTLVLPEGVSVAGFLGNPTAYFETTTIADRQLFLDATAEFVVQPMQDTRELMESGPKVTRFFTTLSAPEMTVDPEFEFNADLSDYSNVHRASQVFACDGDFQNSRTPWSVELPSGAVVYGDSRDWPVAQGELPANRTIQQMATEGEPEVVRDNSELIDSALAKDKPKESAEDGCGCSTPASSRRPGVWLALGLALVGALALRRRR
jgi:MYXO-CTERM domain-containing protein